MLVKGDSGVWCSNLSHISDLVTKQEQSSPGVVLMPQLHGYLYKATERLFFVLGKSMSVLVQIVTNIWYLATRAYVFAPRESINLTDGRCQGSEWYPSKNGLAVYILWWLSKVSANEMKLNKCNVFSHWQRPYWPIHRQHALVGLFE